MGLRHAFAHGFDPTAAAFVDQGAFLLVGLEAPPMAPEIALLYLFFF